MYAAATQREMGSASTLQFLKHSRAFNPYNKGRCSLFM